MRIMSTCFAVPCGDPVPIAIMDLVDYYGHGYIITRINVPCKFRGQGKGRELLQKCLEEADATNTTLWLEILSTGELTYEQLEAWYTRHGFIEYRIGLYRRRPKK